MPVMSRPGKKLTYADFVLFPEDGNQHELIDGVHYVTPSPRLGHQELVGRLYLAIGNFLASRRHLGRIFLSPVDVVMSEYDIVVPDLVFVAAEQRGILTELNVQGSPALVVEILSPSTRRRDLGIKRKLYEEKGVREYWIVDPKGMCVSVYRRIDGTFRGIATLLATSDDQLSTPLLPELTISLRELFAELP